MVPVTQTFSQLARTQLPPDFEPDDEALKLNIQAGLRSMVDEAKKLDDELANGIVGSDQRERLTADHLATLKTICQLAEEQFRIWASGEQLDRAWSETMIKKQQAILERMRKESIRRKYSMTARPVVQEFWKPSITPEEDAQMSRTFSLARRSNTASQTSSFKAPSILSAAFTDPLDALSGTERERSGIHTADQEWVSMDRVRGRSFRPLAQPLERGFGDRPPPSASRPIATKRPFTVEEDWSDDGFDRRGWRIQDIEEGLRKREEAANRREEELARKAEELKREDEARRKRAEELRREDEVRRLEGKARQRDDGEAERKEAELRIKEDEADRKTREAAIKEEEARRLGEEVRRKEQEVKKKEQEARKKERDARLNEEETRSRELEARRKEEEVKKKEEEARRKEAEVRVKEGELRRREEELRRKEEEVKRKERDAQLKEEEAKRKEKETRWREMEARQMKGGAEAIQWEQETEDIAHSPTDVPERGKSIRRKPSMTTRPITQEFWKPSIAPEEDAFVTRTFTLKRRSSPAGRSSPLPPAPEISRPRSSAGQPITTKPSLMTDDALPQSNSSHDTAASRTPRPLGALSRKIMLARRSSVASTVSEGKAPSVISVALTDPLEALLNDSVSLHQAPCLPIVEPDFSRTRAEARRLEDKVAAVTARKCSVEEVSALHHELQEWLTHNEKQDDQVSSLILSAALLRAILVNYFTHSEAIKSVEATLDDSELTVTKLEAKLKQQVNGLVAVDICIFLTSTDSKPFTPRKYKNANLSAQSLAGSAMEERDDRGPK